MGGTAGTPTNPAAPAAAVVAEIASVRETIAGWFELDSAGWPASDRSQIVTALVGLRERIDAALVDVVADWEREQLWAVDGSLAAKQWLRTNTALGDSDAHRLVRSARLVRRSSALRKAVAVEEVTAGHVDALARSVTPPRAAIFERDVDVLVDAARRLGIDDTATMVRRWAAYADDELGRGEPEDLHERRGVWFRQVGGQTEARVGGEPAELATLRNALDRLEPPDPSDVPGGARTLAQRRYDALVSLAHLGLQDGAGRVDPDHTVTVVIDATTLAGGFDPHGRSEIPGWSSVLPARVERLLCDSWVSRLLLGPDGEVLDLGRRARFFSSAQKRAIRIRDGGCALACCDRPPEWTDVHHLDPYGPPTDGPTDLGNGLSLCRSHHTLVHQGWQPVRRADGTWYLQPP